MNVAKLSAIANRLLDLAAEVESGITYVGFDTLVQISQDISAAIEPKATKPVDCWAHLKGMTGNLSPPSSPERSSCSCPKKVSFDLD
jgi:hypothetical protein